MTPPGTDETTREADQVTRQSQRSPATPKPEWTPLYRWRHAVKNSTLRPTAKTVADAASFYMSPTGKRCYPGAHVLARDTGLGLSTVRRSLALLEREQWLRVVERGGWREGKNYATEYESRHPDPRLELVPELSPRGPAPGPVPLRDPSQSEQTVVPQRDPNYQGTSMKEQAASRSDPTEGTRAAAEARRERDMQHQRDLAAESARAPEPEIDPRMRIRAIRVERHQGRARAETVDSSRFL